MRASAARLTLLALYPSAAVGLAVTPQLPGFGPLPEFVPEEHAARGDKRDDDEAPAAGNERAAGPQEPGAPTQMTQEQLVEMNNVLSDDKDDENVMPLIDAVSALPGGLLMLKARPAAPRGSEAMRGRGAQHHSMAPVCRRAPQNSIKEEATKDPELSGMLKNIVSMGGSGALMKQPFWARLFSMEGAEGERVNDLGLGPPKLDIQTLFRQRAATVGATNNDGDDVEGGIGESASASAAFKGQINGDLAVNALRTLMNAPQTLSGS